jgi:4-hydroxy-2-oxoheptanedioate aldolase
LKILKKLGAVAIKQSLEDEGANFEEIRFLRKITKKLDLKLNVKIGGCEAKNDIFFCHSIFVNGIVAPMVESEYALKKFIQTVPSSFKGDLYVNLESKNAISNLNKILNTNEFKKLKGVVVGRSDLVGSLDLAKKEVDSRKILNLMEYSLKKIKKSKKLVKMGEIYN